MFFVLSFQKHLSYFRQYLTILKLFCRTQYNISINACRISKNVCILKIIYRISKESDRYFGSPLIKFRKMFGILQRLFAAFRKKSCHITSTLRNTFVVSWVCLSYFTPKGTCCMTGKLSLCKRARNSSHKTPVVDRSKVVSIRSPRSRYHFSTP